MTKCKIKKTFAMLITVLVILLSALLFICNFYKPCQTWDKPQCVPQNAIWLGGCDGGSWVELVSKEDSIYRFRIYRDWNGALIIDSKYTIDLQYDVHLNEDNLQEYLCNIIEDTIVLRINLNNEVEYIKLTPVLPPFFKESIE